MLKIEINITDPMRFEGWKSLENGGRSDEHKSMAKEDAWSGFKQLGNMLVTSRWSTEEAHTGG